MAKSIYRVISWILINQIMHMLRSCDCMTATPLSALQVTPPSDVTPVMTSRQMPFASSANRESRTESKEPIGSRNSNLTAWSTFQQHASSQTGYSKVTFAGSSRDGAYVGTAHVRKEPDLREDNVNRKMKEVPTRHSGMPRTVSPLENELDEKSDQDVIQGSKHPFPPIPGVGYIPPAANIEQQTAPVVFQQERDIPRVEYVTADCFSNYMKIAVQFNGTFEGLVYSSGYAQDTDCIYVNGSGLNRYEFSIRLNRCGTLGRPEFDPSLNEVPDRNHFMWNTITVQYNPEIEEDWDEHFQVTCEYGYEFRRTVTFPVVGVEKNTASPYLVTLSPPQCYMEVRMGFGPNGKRLTGPVTVGDPLTLMIHMESDSTEFDVAVSSCFAHNGATKRLQLIDANGCILKEQLMSPFRGARSINGAQHVMLYAYFKAFRFTSSPALYLECDVHMCHGTCPAQRCHWKSLTKRSVSNQATTENPLVSQNVSLFQALQVMQEAPDSAESGGSKPDLHSGTAMCLPITGLTAVTTSFTAVFIIAIVMCVFLCIRLRKMKAKLDVPGMNAYLPNEYFHKPQPRKRL